MADLSHWDFAEHFRGKEVAELILGIPPESNDGWEQLIGGANGFTAKITPVLRRMERALNEAGEQLYGASMSGKPVKEALDAFPVLPHGLQSETMLRSRDTKTEIGLAIFREWHPKFDNRFGDAYFTRTEVHRWLCAISMQSVYQFEKIPVRDEQIFNSFDDVSEEFRQWLIMETWPYEAAMWLLAGVIPREIYEGFGYFTIKGKLLHNDNGEKDEKAHVIGNLKRLWLSNPDNPERATPAVYLKWAAQKNIVVDWLKSVRNEGYLLPEATPSIKDEKPLTTTERNTLLKLVIGMAIKGYSHDPAASKSTAPKEIADDLAELGMTITDDTVRKYLKQAADSVLPAKQRQP